ncbi:hypothetical protein B0F90DRAFT_1689147 [Multifurca ochricompacta]|uniref:Uncharacterized protein n=1 Tax=Multifurca ochricompacta TaxID=376703 RepID=A0AAD4QRT4_9AGAM|nr:hypothetical protein B0F90DRAFT_1689147 [Multifurca ochricompacta]
MDEYHPDARILKYIVEDFDHKIYDTEGYPTFSCDFCGSDIFVSFFCCKDCSLSTELSSTAGDGLHICPGCYVEGRSCRCGRLMDPMQCWPLQILYGDYNRAVRALVSVGVDKFNEIGDHNIIDHDEIGTFEAGITIQKWQTEFIANKGVSHCYATKQPHAIHTPFILPCKKCHGGLCFVHLARAGVHSSEAIVLYRKSPDQAPWHAFHLSREKEFVSNKETILAAEVSGDGFSTLIGQRLALAAQSFPHCQPLNVTHIKLGWYDRLISSTIAASSPFDPMDMSFPRDGNGWGDYGSPLTEISPEDSVSNTLVRTGTPPRGKADSALIKAIPTST